MKSPDWMTNYDHVLREIRAEQQGEITGRQEKQIAVAAEHTLEEYRNEQLQGINLRQDSVSYLAFSRQPSAKS